MKNQTSQTLETKSLKELLSIFNSIEGVRKVIYFNSEIEAKRAIFTAQMK